MSPAAKDRDWKASEDKRRLALRELDLILEALGHDTQFDIRRACYLLELRALPRRMKREEQLQELEKALALKRERLGWGRPWTVYQLRRIFYAKPGTFTRVLPKPVTKAELGEYVPVKPPGPKGKASGS